VQPYVNVGVWMTCADTEYILVCEMHPQQVGLKETCDSSCPFWWRDHNDSSLSSAS